MHPLKQQITTSSHWILSTHPFYTSSHPSVRLIINTLLSNTHFYQHTQHYTCGSTQQDPVHHPDTTNHDSTPNTTTDKPAQVNNQTVWEEAFSICTLLNPEPGQVEQCLPEMSKTLRALLQQQHVNLQRQLDASRLWPRSQLARPVKLSPRASSQIDSQPLCAPSWIIHQNDLSLSLSLCHCYFKYLFIMLLVYCIPYYEYYVIYPNWQRESLSFTLLSYYK